MSLRYLQTPAVSLYTGIGIADTSVRITPFPLDLDGNKLTTADIGTKSYFTIDPKVLGYEEICSFTGIIDNGDNTATLTGVVRSLGSKYPYTTTGNAKVHGSSAVVVFSDNPQLFGDLLDYINAAVISGGVPATLTSLGILQLATALQVTNGTATGSSGGPLAVTPDVLAASAYGTALTTIASLTGIISPYIGRTAPAGWLMCDGSTASRAAQAALFAIIAPAKTFTVTIASPAVFTASSAHGLVVGDRISLTTTSGLPSGLAVNTDYYIIATGLTSTQFEVALSPGGAAINTSGSQSGTHTFYITNFGKGDGSTTFTLPDARNKFLIGMGAATTISLAVEAASVNTSTDAFTVPDATYPLQGQAVTLTTTGGLPSGLATATTYYVIRVDSTHVQFATTQANASAATPSFIDLTTQGTGVHTILYTLSAHTVISAIGGEETHGISVSESAAHIHSSDAMRAAADGTNFAGAGTNVHNAATIGSVGGNVPHNNMPPYMAVNYIIKT